MRRNLKSNTLLFVYSGKAESLHNFRFVLAHFYVMIPRNERHLFALSQLFMLGARAKDRCRQIQVIPDFLSFSSGLERQPEESRVGIFRRSQNPFRLA